MTWRITTVLANARLLAVRAAIDSAETAGKILLYDNTPPVAGDPAGVTPNASISLTKPCGEVADGKLTLTQPANHSDLVKRTGDIKWARIVNGDGVALADGTVSDLNGNGDIKIGGGGGTSNLVIYLGGTPLVGTLKIT